MKRRELRKIIKEELLKENKGRRLFDDTLSFIRKEIKKQNLTDNDILEFKELMKDWVK